MTDPKPLGTKAATLVDSASKELEQVAEALFDVSLALFSKDYRGAMEKLRIISSRNLLALKVLNFLQAGDFKRAEEAIMDAKLERKKGTESR